MLEVQETRYTPSPDELWLQRVVDVGLEFYAVGCQLATARQHQRDAEVIGNLLNQVKAAAARLEVLLVERPQ